MTKWVKSKKFHTVYKSENHIYTLTIHIPEIWGHRKFENKGT